MISLRKTDRGCSMGASPVVGVEPSADKPSCAGASSAWCVQASTKTASGHERPGFMPVVVGDRPINGSGNPGRAGLAVVVHYACIMLPDRLLAAAALICLTSCTGTIAERSSSAAAVGQP